MGLSTNCCIVFFARSTLIFVNLLFFALSVGVLYIGSKLRVDGWLEIVEKDHPYFDHIYQWALIGATSLIALITLSGCYGAVFRHRCILCFYGIFVMCAIIAFVFLTAGSAFSWILANSWQRVQRIDRIAEQDVEINFNKAYCLSEAAYLCTSTSTSSEKQWIFETKKKHVQVDLRDLFFDRNVSTILKHTMDQAGPEQSIADLCMDSNLLLKSIQNEKIYQVCEWCERIATLRPYSQIVSWVNKECVPTSSSAAYCAANIYREEEKKNQELPSRNPIFQTIANYNESPYQECRDVFLKYWILISKYLTILSAILLLYMSLVLKFACRLIRTRRGSSHLYYDDIDYSNKERRPLIGRT